MKIGGDVIKRGIPRTRPRETSIGRRYTRSAVEKIYNTVELRARGAFHTEELDEVVKRSEQVVALSSANAQKYALERHMRVLSETNKRAEWLNQTASGTAVHGGAQGVGVGVARKKERTPIDPDRSFRAI